MKVQFKLAALTRVEYMVEKEVPDGTSQEELNVMLDQIYEDTDGSEFWDDPDFWDKGYCEWEIVE
jgi:hypothetical protein